MRRESDFRSDMHVNYRYLLHKAEQLAASPRNAILDFGCGAGEMVEEGRRCGLNICGAELFYEGGDTETEVREKGLLGTSVREITGGRIPFPDRYFDLVVSNQVLEHVEDLSGTLWEISRVLKPGGAFLSLFPSREVLREGHSGIPFLHWFPKNSTVRLYYAAALRLFGLGYHKGNKSTVEWASDFINWLDRFTFYRRRREIFDCFHRYFSFSLIEEDYISFRLSASGRSGLVRIFKAPLIKPLGCELMRRLSGLVILAKKEDSQRD